MVKGTQVLPNLFNLGEIETKAVLKATNRAHQALGELKGVVQSILTLLFY
ncbi:hypothetical protein [Mergibacter septicus]|nr:hypothetical protein [Mergibacter septicus]